MNYTSNNQDQGPVAPEISLDFTGQQAPQKLAIMPERMALKLLREYAMSIEGAPIEEIAGKLCREIQNEASRGYEEGSKGSQDKILNIKEICSDFILEREILDHIRQNNLTPFTPK